MIRMLATLGMSGPISLGAAQQGDRNPDYPGCTWDASKGDWACDDGYWLNSGEAIADDNNGSIQTNAGNVTIRELGQVSLDDLSRVIDAQGFYDTSASDPLVAAARAHWWLYSVDSGNAYSGESDHIVRITKRNLVLYGSLAAAGLLLFSVLKK